MNGSHLVQLLPRVAPGPVVRFVLAEPHGHQFVPTVIEDRPVRQMQTENIRSFHELIIMLLPLFQIPVRLYKAGWRKPRIKKRPTKLMATVVSVKESGMER